MAIDSRINQSKLPKHVAVIMDGNGRWAKQRGKLRTFGHSKGVKAVRETVEAAAEIGIEYLSRPKFEINALMTLLVKTISKETKTLTENNIRLNAIGDLESLPSSCLRELNEAIEKTKDNTRMTLTLALSYSSKWEMTEAIKAIAKNVKSGILEVDAIDESTINQHLCTVGIPDPELLIRTSGEHRISNFLLWQIAYAELYFTDKLWPDFERADFETAIIDYQGRERRFGKISE
jgi:undecaprenyl diphosphate synthase